MTSGTRRRTCGSESAVNPASLTLCLGTPAANAALKMAELTTSLNLAAYARFADAQEAI